MDIFNRKKVKKLEQEVYSLTNEIEGYIKNERNWSKQIDGLEKISSQTMEQNQKLIKWLETILDTIGVMEVREKTQVKIPVYKELGYGNYNSRYRPMFEEERITIPEITIIKLK